MFQRLSLLHLFLLLAAAPLVRANSINFTPHTETRTVDGFTVREAFITAGPRLRYYFTPPADWIVTGSPETLRFHLVGHPNACCLISMSSLVPKRYPFTGPSLEEYRRQALATVPQDATDACIVSETPDFFTLFDWTGLEVVVTYSLNARLFRASVMFLNIGHDEQMLVVAARTQAAFDAFRADTMRLLTSWCPQTLP